MAMLFVRPTDRGEAVLCYELVFDSLPTWSSEASPRPCFEARFSAAGASPSSPLHAAS